jgi:Bacterial Ig domain
MILNNKIVSPVRRFFPLRQFFYFLLLGIWILSLIVQSYGFAEQETNSTNSFWSQANNSFFIESVSLPSVSFRNLRNYARVSNQISVSVQANDVSGISRVELYVNGVLLGTNNITPNTPNALASFNWNTAAAPNGKNILQAKAYNTAGNVQTATLVVISHNFSISTPTGNTIALNPYVKYQTMDGWEAVAEAGQLFSPAWNNYKNALLDQAVNDLGINRLRLEITSGIENPTDYFAQWRAGQITESQYNAKKYEIINDDANPNTINASGFKWSQLDSTIDNIVLPMRQRLQARGETLWVNVNYVDFGTSTFEHKNYPAEYAEFVLATYQHLQSRYGFVPNSWEIVLEPDTSTASWSSTQVAQAIKAAGDLLTANNFTPRFVAPSTTSAANAPIYIDQIAQTTGAMQYVSEFSYHRYCCATDTVLQSIFNRAVQFNKRSAMLEWIGADYNTLHQDLKSGRNSSWQQFTLAGPLSWGPDNGDRYYLIDDTNTANPIIAMGSRTKVLRQYFKFIRDGAQRIEALTGNASFDPVAFINTNGKYVVVVNAATSGSFNVQGLPAGTYGIKYTTASQYNIDLPDLNLTAGQSLTTNIPTSGVITVYAK